MPDLESTARHLRASIASNSRWAAEPDRAAATAAARTAFMVDKFERMVDPEGALSTDERRRRADNARRAHFSRMALASANVRREKQAAERNRRLAADLRATADSIEAAGSGAA